MYFLNQDAFSRILKLQSYALRSGLNCWAWYYVLPNNYFAIKTFPSLRGYDRWSKFFKVDLSENSSCRVEMNIATFLLLQHTVRKPVPNSGRTLSPTLWWGNYRMCIRSVAGTVIFYLFSKAIIINLMGKAILSVMNILIEVEETAEAWKRLFNVFLVRVLSELSSWTMLGTLSV